MNIALSAVVISILLIPPIVFYLSLSIGLYPRAIPKFSLFEGILASSVIALLIHAIALLLIPNEIRFDILVKILGGDLKNLEGTFTNATLEIVIKDFARYNAILLAIMFGLGRLTRYILITTGWHSKLDVLNLYNKWWYLFSGYVGEVENYDMIFVDAVVKIGNDAVIYSGLLTNFECKNGDLDRIYLQQAVRRPFNNKLSGNAGDLINQPNEAFSIPGQILTISYSNIVNMNVNFIVLELTDN